jgi:mercuric ion binding protein
MKSIIILSIGLIFSIKIHAQSTIQTTTIAVKGNCDECKERIENAADIKGVKNAIWKEETHILTVTFDSKKVTLEQIEKTIAKSGHETGNQKADSSAYSTLPSCCKYQSTDCKKK